MTATRADGRPAPGDVAANRAIGVLLANKHHHLRSVLRALLHADGDLTVVGEARGDSSLAPVLKSIEPDVVVIDLPALGHSAVSKLAVHGAGIVVTSLECSRELAERLFGAGALGYVLTQRADVELAAAVRAAACGRRFLSPTVAATAA